MNLDRLRLFLQIVDSGSMSAAARAVHLTQPALSRTLRLLEDEVGVALFERRGRALVLDMAAVVSLAFVTFVFPWVFPWYMLPTVALLAVGPRTRLNTGLMIVAGAASMMLMAFWAVLQPR